MDALLALAYGLGVDSTADLVGMAALGIRSDIILFADVGAEKESTYNYLPIINTWLDSVRFPQQTYSGGSDQVPLGVFLHREYPQMYPKLPNGIHGFELEFDQASFDFEEAAWYETLKVNLEAYRQYLRNGAGDPHPQSEDFGLMLCEFTNEISAIDGEFSKQHGRSHWRLYDPAFYQPMMAIRRAAVAAGEDPDAAVAAHPELDSP